MRRLVVADAAGCLHCGERITPSMPVVVVPCRNEVQQLEVFVPFHERCQRENARGHGIDGFTARLQHVVDDHPEWLSPETASLDVDVATGAGCRFCSHDFARHKAAGADTRSGRWRWQCQDCRCVLETIENSQRELLS